MGAPTTIVKQKIDCLNTLLIHLNTSQACHFYGDKLLHGEMFLIEPFCRFRTILRGEISVKLNVFI